MEAPGRIKLKEDGVFVRSKKIQNAEDLINNISVIKARKDGLLAVTRHYEDGWFLYIRAKEVKSEDISKHRDSRHGDIAGS